MPDVFEVLSRDHREVEQMLSALESGPTAAAGASPGELDERKRMTQALVIEESRHQAAEQMLFWPIVRDRLPEGPWLAGQAAGQEREGKDVLDKLEKEDPGDPGFEALLGEFIVADRDHMAYEERQVWPKLRPALTAAEASELGIWFEQARKLAPGGVSGSAPAR
jgi:hypothetical protein